MTDAAAMRGELERLATYADELARLLRKAIGNLPDPRVDMLLDQAADVGDEIVGRLVELAEND